MKLKVGDYVRIRLNENDDWMDAFVRLASDTNPSSVLLLFDGAVRAGGGGLVFGGLPVTIDYEAQTVTSVLGDIYEIEVPDDQEISEPAE
jgi:hypothetical protein